MNVASAVSIGLRSRSDLLVDQAVKAQVLIGSLPVIETMISGSSVLLLLLLPSSALAAGSVTVSIKDLVAVSGVESLNIQGTDLVAAVEVHNMRLSVRTGIPLFLCCNTEMYNLCLVNYELKTETAHSRPSAN